MTFEEIYQQIDTWKRDGKKIFATSSFQTQSMPLLHMLARIDSTIPIMFLNTGYLFPETIVYRDEVTELLNLNIVNLRPSVSKINQRDQKGRLYFTSDPESCCYLNKIQPLEPCLQEYDIWVNGIRADQNKNRQALATFVDGPFGCQRYHPMLDWTASMIHDYIDEYCLPHHPLNLKGYMSVGCEPCTRPPDASGDRSGRWYGQNKTECGLHTQLARKQQP